jgi:hypothetical protein
VDNLSVAREATALLVSLKPQQLATVLMPTRCVPRSGASWW